MHSYAVYCKNNVYSTCIVSVVIIAYSGGTEISPVPDEGKIKFSASN